MLLRSSLVRGPAAGLILAAAVGLGAAPTAAATLASRPAVIVDWSALDALGPAAARTAFAPVRLRPPPRQVATPVRAPASPPAPPQRGAAIAPAAAPAQPAPEPPRPAAAPPPAATASAATMAAPALSHITVIRFAPGRSDIPQEGREVLDSLATQLAANARLRLQLVAYASGSGDDAIAARRLSLARAVQMRSYLIAKGVPGVRMDVRALGDRNDNGGPADRVDVVLLDR